MAKRFHTLKERYLYHRNRVSDNLTEYAYGNNPKLFYSKGFSEYFQSPPHATGSTRAKNLTYTYGYKCGNSWRLGFNRAKKAAVKKVRSFVYSLPKNEQRKFYSLLNTISDNLNGSSKQLTDKEYQLLKSILKSE